MFVCLQNITKGTSDEMLPSIPGSAQQFHSLPACIEDLSVDLLGSGELQVDYVGDSFQPQFDELFTGATGTELQELFEKLYPSSMQYSYTGAAAGLVFENAKMASLVQDQRNTSSSPVIPLSVQQEQLDSIDPQIISQSNCFQDDVQVTCGLVSSDEGAPTTTTPPHLLAERLTQTSPETTDQTVPFRRHDSFCSTMSSCSEIKRERCSLSTEAESTMPSSPFTPPSLSLASTSQLNHGARRGRPCHHDVSLVHLPRHALNVFS